MSRRCDREDVAWDDGRYPCQRGKTSFDALHGGYGFGGYLARRRAGLWDACVAFTRMKHLRERPKLPPWGSAAREAMARRYDRLAETHPIYEGMWRAWARILRRGEP